MLGPEGLAVFFTTPEVRERLRLLQYGWHMVEHAGDFDRTDWTPAGSARCFEPGSPNMLGIHALNASLSLLEDVGMEAVEAQALQRAQTLTDAVLANDVLQLLSRAEPERMSGIVTFRRRDLDADGHTALYRHLMQTGVICALRGGGIRFSPHFYTDYSDMEQALDEVLGFRASG
jgi:selenocysteine lyase/cysteine desulfurase